MTSGDRTAVVGLRRSRPGLRLAVLLVLVVALLIGARAASLLLPAPRADAAPGRPVAVVGVTGRTVLTTTDQAVLTDRASTAEVGAVSTRTRHPGDCPAAGWATLGAGRSTSVGSICHLEVAGGRVLHWPELVAAVGSDHGDAHLGTLAATVPGCILAVGPGAALAAARADGSVDHYQSVPVFLAHGALSPCPVTLVDAGAHSDAVLGALARRTDISLTLTGIGPPPGLRDSGLEALYRVGSGPPGWLTSASTRRTGLVTLSDLSRTLMGSGRPSPTAVGTTLPVDGATLEVVPAQVTAAEADQRLRAAAAQPGALTTGYLALGAAAVILLVGTATTAAAGRRWGLRSAAAAAAVLPGAMTLAGAAPWDRAGRPGVALSLVVLGAWVVLAAAARAVASALVVPVAVAGTGVALLVLTVDGLLGGVMQPRSMLNPHPLDGGRWYGFGNITFAAYACLTVVLIGHVLVRLRDAGRPRSAVATGGLLGIGAVLVDGWPSLGADVGGMVTLTPVLMWLVVRATGRTLSWSRLLLGGSGTLAVAVAIGWWDWRRGPGAWTHLGAFVQRLVAGDAGGLVLRKAASAWGTVTTPTGLGLLAFGVVVWVVVLRVVRRDRLPEVETLRLVAGPVLATAVLGTLVNDSGVIVGATVSGGFLLTVIAFSLEGWRPKSTRPEPVEGLEEVAPPVRRVRPAPRSDRGRGRAR